MAFPPNDAADVVVPFVNGTFRGNLVTVERPRPRTDALNWAFHNLMQSKRGAKVVDHRHQRPRWAWANPVPSSFDKGPMPCRIWSNPTSALGPKRTSPTRRLLCRFGPTEIGCTSTEASLARTTRLVSALPLIASPKFKARHCGLRCRPRSRLPASGASHLQPKLYDFTMLTGSSTACSKNTG